MLIMPFTVDAGAERRSSLNTSPRLRDSGGPGRGVWGCALAILFALCGACEARGSAPPHGPVRDTGRVDAVDFHGWPAMALRNGRLEMVVVPAIGRIMSFGFTGDGGASDPLWRHGQLGPGLAPDENGWINFGGDKAWPAPQADWQRVVGKGWPPPATFDARPHTATVRDGSHVETVSAVDPAYGLRVRRTASLFDDVMVVDTAYEKVEGPRVRVAIWTITQLASPDRVFALLPERSAFAGGHRSLMPAPPKDLRVDGRLLGLARDTNEKTMIASDADALLWVGPGRDLLIEKAGTYTLVGDQRRPTAPGAAQPDGARAQIYTSPDGAEPYVELELLGPLVDLAPGQGAMMSVRYRLLRRESADADAEARRVFGRELGTAPPR